MRSEPCLGDANNLAIECRDCGHTRWRRPAELYRSGFKPSACIADVGKRLYCSVCREAGLPAKNIAIDVMFQTDAARREADLYRLSRTPAARAAG
jgi:hypothetical protein